MASVLGEQELGARGAVTAETSAKVGQLLGAQILVVGSVTSFEQQAKNDGFTLGIGGADFGGGLGHSTTRGVIGMDIRLLDTTTGQVIASTHVQAKLKQSANSLDLTGRGVSAGKSGFSQSVLGDAAREAIDKAVVFIQGALRDVAWIGYVSDVSGDQVFLSAGAASGVRPDDRFQVSRVARRITDPVSNEVLGVVEDRLGLVQVAAVQDRFSIAGKLSDFAPQRGDMVRYVQG